MCDLAIWADTEDQIIKSQIGSHFLVGTAFQ